MKCPQCGGIGRTEIRIRWALRRLECLCVKCNHHWVPRHIINGNYWPDATRVCIGYARSFEVITRPKELASTIRSGEEFFLCHDGVIMCRQCVLENYRLIISSIHDRRNDGWRVIGLPGSREEWTESHCAHCGEEL